jgi:hypothetical protein
VECGPTIPMARIHWQASFRRFVTCRIRTRNGPTRLRSRLLGNCVTQVFRQIETAIPATSCSGGKLFTRFERKFAVLKPVPPAAPLSQTVTLSILMFLIASTCNATQCSTFSVSNNSLLDLRMNGSEQESAGARLQRYVQYEFSPLLRRRY